MAEEKQEETWSKGMEDSYSRLTEQFVKDGESQWTVPDANTYGNSIGNHWDATVESTGQAIISDLGTPLLNIGSDVVTTADNLGSMGYNLTVGAFGQGWGQYQDVVDASCSAALDYLTEKIDRIRTLWNTMTPVSVGTLLDEIAPFATDWSVAISTLGDKCSDMIAYILDIDNPDGDWMQLVKNLGEDALEGLIDNPEFEEAFSNLGLVKAFADGLGAISTGIQVAKDTMEFLEPWAPTIEIAKELIESAKGNFQAAVHAMIHSEELMLTFLFDTYRLGMKYARKLLFNMKFDVPMLLTGALGTLSVRSAVAKFNYDKGTDVYDQEAGQLALAHLFDDDFFETSYATPEWTKALDNLGKLQTEVLNNGYLNEKLTKYGVKGYGQKLLARTAQDVLKSASDRARKVAYVPDFSGVTEWPSGEEYLSTITRDRLQNTPTNYFTGSLEGLDPSLSPVNDEDSIQRFSFTDWNRDAKVF